MRTFSRLTMLIAVLAVGVTAQLAIWNHLEAARPASEQTLQHPLVDVPLVLGDWKGVDREIEDENLLYADQHLQRVYVHQKTGQALSLWIAYSSVGADRGHHPEVCMMVAGQPEDETARNALPVEGHAAAVQEYRYGRPGKYQRVFYWHYTLEPSLPGTTKAQQLYYRLHHRSSSMTMEVFAPELTPESGELAREFVQLIDASVQPIVGPTAQRGSDRSPVTYVADT